MESLSGRYSIEVTSKFNSMSYNSKKKQTKLFFIRTSKLKFRMSGHHFRGLYWGGVVNPPSTMKTGPSRRAKVILAGQIFLSIGLRYCFLIFNCSEKRYYSDKFFVYGIYVLYKFL